MAIGTDDIWEFKPFGSTSVYQTILAAKKVKMIVCSAITSDISYRTSFHEA